MPAQTLLLNLDRLVNSVDARRPGARSSTSSGAAFDGTGADLQRLIDTGNALTQAATDGTARDGPAHRRRADRAGHPARLRAAPSRASPRTWPCSAPPCATSDADLRAIFDNGTVAAQQLDRLLRENRPAIATLLGNLLTVAQVDGGPHRRAASRSSSTYPDVVAGGYTVVPGDGTAHFGLVDQTRAAGLPRYDDPRRSPNETSNTPGQDRNARCTNPPPGGQVRGSRERPRSTGRDPPTEAPSYLWGGYDAATGTASVTDGRPLRIGSPRRPAEACSERTRGSGCCSDRSGSDPTPDTADRPARPGGASLPSSRPSFLGQPARRSSPRRGGAASRRSCRPRASRA